MTLASINPTTGETLKTFAPFDDAAIEQRLALAATRARDWRRTSYAERARLMNRAADILEAEKEAFGRLMTLEMGKIRRAGVEEAAKCARACRYYAEHAERFLADTTVPTEAARSFVRYQPLGVVLAVMPWNFPFWQVIRFAAPALMAGNVGLLKHASNVPQCALALEDLFLRAGFPEGVFQTLLIGSKQVAPLIADDRIAAVTLTGSEAAGRSVASVAGREIKKTVLELGGSDPFIVMPSAKLDVAVATAVRARTINSGQSCIAAKRFIVHERIAEEFERRFVAAMAALRVGDPMDEHTDVGPLATAEIRDGLDAQVRDTVAAGARVLCGGTKLDRPGFFYAPTVLSAVPSHSPAYCDELFGPVAPLFIARDVDHAIHLANDTSFGLAASAWTEDLSERERLITEIEAGQVFLNAMVASDPRLPFGGVKRSGYGRELSDVGLREFVNIKSVWIQDAAPARTDTE
jgi:succinate-semialdehyde dehydrogenase/glutarate-semialdehyde dehydrogenase